MGVLQLTLTLTLGVAAARVLAEGEGWARHALVEGPTLRAARAGGITPAQAVGLASLVEQLQAADLYVGDLHAKNLIWDGDVWVVIDCGAIRRRKGRLPKFAARPQTT